MVIVVSLITFQCYKSWPSSNQRSVLSFSIFACSRKPLPGGMFMIMCSPSK